MHGWPISQFGILPVRMVLPGRFVGELRVRMLPRNDLTLRTSAHFRDLLLKQQGILYEDQQARDRRGADLKRDCARYRSGCLGDEGSQ